MILKISVAGVALFFCITTVAQDLRIDSLVNALSKTNEKEQRADLLHELASASWDYDFQQAYMYAQQSLQVSRGRYTKGEVQALTDIGLYYYFKGDYNKALTSYKEALKVCAQNNFGNYPAYTLTRLGNLFRVQAEFDSAKFYYNESLRSLQHQRGDMALSSVYQNLGLLEIDLSRFDSALPYLCKALAIRLQMKDSLLIGESWKTIGQVYQGVSLLDSAVYYYEKAYGLAKRFKDPELEMFYHINRGEIHFGQGDYRNATRNFQAALDLLKTHDFRRYHAVVLGQIARVYDAQGDYQHALEHLLNALRIHQSLNSRQEIGRVYGAMGWVYMNQKNDSMATLYANRSLAIMEKIKDDAGIAFAHNLLGFINYNTGAFETSLQHYHVALRFRAAIKSREGQAATTFNIARVYEKQGMYDQSEAYLVKVLELDEAAHNQDGMMMTYNALGNLSIRRNNLPAAEHYLQLAHSMAVALRRPTELRDNYKHIADLHQVKGDYKNAILYYNRYIALNDSIFTRQNATKIAEMSALYEVEKQEQEIQLLNQRNEINQDKIQLQNAQIRSQNYILYFSVGGIVLLLVTSYVLLQYYRTKSKANVQLRHLNREISEQKEEIQAQSEELVEANHSLVLLNHQLIEKTEEVEAQSEELRETNEMVTEINRDLDSIVTKRTTQLQEAYKELDTFFYRSSHDFRRPLTTFMGLAEVAKITIRDPSALELFAKVKDTAVSLDKMLIKLHSISDVGAQQLVFKEVLIREIFDTVCDGFQDDLHRYGMETKAVVKLDKPFISYPAMIKVIIENLVENAIHFRGAGHPFIHLNVYGENDRVVIEVADNGQGIRDEYKEKIFDMYFRANDRSKGNGLGLYIVKKAVQKLNGTIQLTSYFGEGSRFAITLPRE